MDTFWSCLELPCSSEDHVDIYVDHSWRHTVKKMSKIQETPQDVEELPQCFWIRQQRLAPGLKCYGLTHDRNEVRFYPQEHNPSPFCSPLVFWEFFDRTPPPPPLVTRHPRRSAMCQATFDFDLLPVFGALAAIQIMLKLRHRARHRVCLQTQVQCCSWHRHQPTITTFHHETHTGLVRKQAWAFFFLHGPIQLQRFTCIHL